MNRYRCTECYEVFEVDTPVDCCPGCGSTKSPEDTKLDTTLTLNWFALRVLCQWAERYTETFPDTDSSKDGIRYLHHIFDMIREQKPAGATALTFGDEIAELQAHFPSSSIQVHKAPPQLPPELN